MKRNYLSGWEKKKKQKAKEQEIQRLSGSLLKYTQKVPTIEKTEEEPERCLQSIERPTTSSEYRVESHISSLEEDGQTAGHVTLLTTEEREEKQRKGQKPKLCPIEGENRGEIGVEIQQEQDSDSLEETEDVTLNLDVGNWSMPVADSIRTEIIRRGSECYQNLEGPFEAVRKPGESAKGKTRQLTQNWFYKILPNGEKVLRKWMVYSQEKKQLFCFCCRLFETKDVNPTTSGFVRGFNSWWKLNPKVSEHENSEAHITNLEKWKTLEARLLQNRTIDSMHQGVVENERKKWRDILHRLLEITLFLAQQNLPFRGHREDPSSENRGNFLELVHLLSHYDPILKEHIVRLQQSLEEGRISVSYLSPEVQNEFISLLGNEIRKEIISEIKKAKYYGVMFDTTPDISHTEQMSQVIRYVQIENREVEVKESFLGFIPLSGKKASDITDEIIQSLEQNGLDLKLCRSQGYDNATTMSGVHTGVQTRIKEQNPKAIFVPCANHSLNLCGMHAFGSVPDCVTFFGTLESIYKFFSCSTHRWEVLKDTVGVTVKRLNDTRWSAHHEAVKSMFNNFEKMVEAVEKLCDDSENLDTRSSAEILMTNVCSFSFICFLNLWYHILCEVNHAQKYLQTEGISLEKCVFKLKSLKLFLVESREELVQNALTYAAKTCVKMDIDIERRQRKRTKKMMPGESAKDVGLSFEEEMKRAMLECIDNFHVELDKRLGSMNKVYELFSVVHSENLIKADNEKITDSVEKFCDTFSDVEKDEMLPEVKRLRSHLKASDIEIEVAVSWTSLQMLKFIIEMDFQESLPNITEALKLFLTTCVSVASCERSFSKLKLIKNYLRSTMSQSRLTSLAIISIENKTAKRVNFDELINQFSNIKARKKTL